MSILFFDGFETVGDQTGLANQADVVTNTKLRYDATVAGGIPSLDSYFLIDDVFGEGFALQMGQNSFSNTNYLEITPPEVQLGAPSASTPKVVIGFRVHIPDNTGRTAVMLKVQGRFSVSSTDRQFDVSYVNAEDLKLTFGSGINERNDTVTDVFTPGEWHYVEVKFKCAESADGGMIQIKVDGNVVLTQDPQDMNNANSIEAYEFFRFQTTNASTSEDYTAYDDIYILDDNSPNTNYLGAVRVRSLGLTSDQDKNWDNNLEMTLGTTLNGASETSLDVGTGGIPDGVPLTGTLRVTLDSGLVRDINYTTHNSNDTFTIDDESWANPNDATAGNLVELTNQRSDNYRAVDENGGDTTEDYVETDVQGTRDRYNVGNTTKTDGIFSLKIEAQAKNMTGGDPALEIELQSGSTLDVQATDVTDTANWDLVVTNYETNPDTSDIW
jgi:hypothetical protein